VKQRSEIGRLGNVKRFRGGLVFKAHRLAYHSTLGWRVIKKKKSNSSGWRQDKRLLEGAMMHSVLMRNLDAFKAVTNISVSHQTHYRGTSLIRNTHPHRTSIRGDSMCLFNWRNT